MISNSHPRTLAHVFLWCDPLKYLAVMILLCYILATTPNNGANGVVIGAANRARASQRGFDI